ncbi:MAG TPA: c-type cytochrome [Bryobacteraceae bacterium]|nr:c-type cytochrome [Bryobacteraceae bacterium]
MDFTVNASLQRCARSLALITATSLCLSAQAPPGGRGRGGGGLLAQAGSADKHIVDPAAADRGKKTYIAECITCHGGSARGTQTGPDLVRSLVVLHDRYGSELGPFLKKGHPTQSTPSANFTQAQVQDLSHFIHQRVGDTLRGSPIFHAQDVLTGDPKAGEAYFNGAGKCNTCHSVKGDLAGIGSKYEPIDMQQKFLFPKPAFGGRGLRSSGKSVTVTVTPPSGKAVTGVLLQLDDFNVSLRDSDGEYHGFTRTPALKVKVNDPYEAHAKLLDQITDKNMHDVTAYLETLK